MEIYKSLYDYLGRAAGPELGAKVAAAATSQGISLQEKQVTNPKYNGLVMMYPVSFLESYFGGVQSENNQGKTLLHG